LVKIRPPNVSVASCRCQKRVAVGFRSLADLQLDGTEVAQAQVWAPK
jgi:hypothetical protein